MSAAEAAEMPHGTHAMVDPEPLEAALAPIWILRCAGCGRLDGMPYVFEYERVALEAAREWRREALLGVPPI